MDWLECWNRPVSCIIVKRRSRTLATECGDIFYSEHYYIISPAYNDLIVSYNVPDVLKFGPLGLYSSPGHPWAPNYAYQMVLEPESLGYRPCKWCGAPCNLGVQGFGFLRISTNNTNDWACKSSKTNDLSLHGCDHSTRIAIYEAMGPWIKFQQFRRFA